ncbi:hypothetical protein BN946_scf184816.g9 [Trametes cinnabarina]|uniref:Uncharacterized protein n=1 Tax=Pycnoporus cinnabarinus TaxID=5643 RepID=A0A060SJP3_PYCCI|nr:hypothetical protein BN946_scf184816.g9 [Trametes cinnabarina]
MQLPPNSPSSPTPLLSYAPALPHLQNHASPARPTSSHRTIEALDLAVRHDQQPTNIQSVTITLHADTIEAIHKQLERPNIIGSISGSTGNNDLDQLLLSLYRIQHGFPFFEERLSQLRSFVMPPLSPPSPTDTNSSGSSIWHTVDSFSSEHELAATLAEINIITSAKRGQRQDHAIRGGTTPPSMPVSPSRPLRCIPTSPPPPSAHPLRFELPLPIASSKRALPIHNVSISDKSNQDSSGIQQATKATIAQPIHPDDPGAAPAPVGEACASREHARPDSPASLSADARTQLLPEASPLIYSITTTRPVKKAHAQMPRTDSVSAPPNKAGATMPKFWATSSRGISMYHVHSRKTRVLTLDAPHRGVDDPSPTRSLSTHGPALKASASLAAISPPPNHTLPLYLDDNTDSASTAAPRSKQAASSAGITTGSSCLDTMLSDPELQNLATPQIRNWLASRNVPPAIWRIVHKCFKSHPKHGKANWTLRLSECGFGDDEVEELEGLLVKDH